MCAQKWPKARIISFSFISRLTGKCATQKIEQNCSSSLCICLHHMAILKSENKKEVSIYPVTGCASRLRSLFKPTMTTNQNRSFNALLSMFVFGAHSRNWIAYTKTLSKWTGKLCRVKINLYKCKYIPDSWQLLSLATFTKDMKARLLPNICELASTRIIVRGRIWFMLNFHTNSSRNRFDYDARCAFYIA